MGQEDDFRELYFERRARYRHLAILAILLKANLAMREQVRYEVGGGIGFGPSYRTLIDSIRPLLAGFLPLQAKIIVAFQPQSP